MPYSLPMVWRDRQRFLPAVLAVTFSAVLIAVQCGLLLGILFYVSLPIAHSRADIWLTTADSSSLSLVQPLPQAWLLRLAGQPEVERTEPYLIGAGSWHKPGQGSLETCLIVGTRLDEGSLGVIESISAPVRTRLTEPGTVVVDEGSLAKLGMRRGSGEVAEINGNRVRVVGTVHGFEGITFLYVFCSLQTARTLLPPYQLNSGLMTYGLARCRTLEDVSAVVSRLRRLYPEMGVYTGQEWSRKVRFYWLFRTHFGTIMGCTVLLALLVGLVVTSGTLYAATVASLREYAVLDALGIPRWRVAALVMAQSLWIGLAGVALALPAVLGMRAAAALIGTQVVLPNGLLIATALLTLGMALVSGVSALRSLKQVEPATLLR